MKKTEIALLMFLAFVAVASFSYRAIGGKKTGAPVSDSNRARPNLASNQSVVSSNNSESNLSFFGFSVGETFEVSRENMKKRQMEYLGEDLMKALASGRAAEIFFHYPKNCGLMLSMDKTSTVICSPGTDELSSIKLYYYQNRLIRIVADVKDPEKAADLMRKKYGELSFIPADTTHSLSEQIKVHPIVRLTSSPIGTEESCPDGCRLGRYAFGSPANAVFGRFDAEKLVQITVFNSEQSSKVVKDYIAQVASERKAASESSKF